MKANKEKIQWHGYTDTQWKILYLRGHIRWIRETHQWERNSREKAICNQLDEIRTIKEQSKPLTLF